MRVNGPETFVCFPVAAEGMCLPHLIACPKYIYGGIERSLPADILVGYHEMDV
jgi:hypothetical protein